MCVYISDSETQTQTIHVFSLKDTLTSLTLTTLIIRKFWSYSNNMLTILLYVKLQWCDLYVRRMYNFWNIRNKFAYTFRRCVSIEYYIHQWYKTLLLWYIVTLIIAILISIYVVFYYVYVEGLFIHKCVDMILYKWALRGKKFIL